MREYVHDLKLMTAENEWFDKPPRSFGFVDVPQVKNEMQKNSRIAFENPELLSNRFSRNQDARVRDEWCLHYVESYRFNKSYRYCGYVMHS